MYFTSFSIVSIVDFEQVNVSWEKATCEVLHATLQYIKNVMKTYRAFGKDDHDKHNDDNNNGDYELFL